MTENTIPQIPKTGPQEAPAWLKHLQNNSWEPEIFISGIMLAFIFAFPSRIFDFSVRLVQDHGVEYLGAFLILIYVTGVFGIFKVFFIVHLLLRFTWAGLLGMSYAFPNGVVKEKLFKNAQDFDYPTPVSMVERLERICSMTFAFPTMLGLVMLMIAAYFGLLLGIYHFLHVPFVAIYVFFILSAVMFSVLMMSKKKSRFRQWYATSLLSSVSAVYQSNLGKWAMSAYIFFIVLLAFPSILTDTEGFSDYLNLANQSQEKREWPNAAEVYEDAQITPKRFARAFMSSEEVKGNFARLSVAYYQEDERIPSRLSSEFATTLDTLQWGTVSKPADLYKIYINDSLASHTQWTNIIVSSTGQRAYQTLLDVSSLGHGIHTVRVEKLLHTDGFLGTNPGIRHRKDWCTFTFMKVED